MLTGLLLPLTLPRPVKGLLFRLSLTRGRVFRELRFQVVLLLEQVRRLNWIAVDAERGFRNRDEAMCEMDAIENQIRGIITDVRAAAGKPTAAPESSLVTQETEKVG